MIPKSQHTVPRMHLQHFAGPDPAGQVWAYDAVAVKQWSAVPEETCVHTHFYSAERDDGTMDTRIEEFLSQVEGRAAPVYQGLLEGRLPKNPQDRLNFAQFLALMYTRTVSMRRIASEIRGKGAQIHNYAYGSNPKAFDSLMRRYDKDKEIDAEQRERVRQAMLDPSGYRIEVSKESTFVALNASDKLTRILDGMKWSIICAQQGYFITSDNPLVRMIDPKTYHPSYGDRGFVNRTAEVTFPLSPKLLLLLAWEEKLREHGAFGRDDVHHVNMTRAAASERFLFAHINDRRIARLAKKFKNTRPEVAVGGGGLEKFAPVEVKRRMNVGN